MTLDECLDAAWRDHADHTDEVARRVATSLDLPATAQEVSRFFGHAVLALVRRAQGDAAGFTASRRQALELLEAVPQDERSWCGRERTELNA